MNLEKQCEKWANAKEFDKIISAVEQMPAQQRTPKLDLYLASAYCSTYEGWKDRDKLRKVIALCKPHLEIFADNFIWNFNMGYAYTQLGMEAEAFKHYIVAKYFDIRPRGMEKYLKRSKELLEFPRFEVPFKQRVEQSWKVFEEEQPSILELMEERLDINNLKRIRDKVAKTIFTTFNNVYMSIEYDGKVLKVVLSPGGSRTMLYTLKYFIDHAPSNVSDKISFILGTLPKRNAELTIPNKGKVSLSDIPTWVEKTKSGDYKIYLLAQPMQKLSLDDPDRVFLFLYQLLFNAIGEIAVMKHIAGVEIIKKPRRENSIRLSELGNYLKSEGIELDQDPTPLLTNTTVYELEPAENEKSVLHMDIKRGESQCYELPRDYFDKEERNIDLLQAAGATAGFIIYHLDSFKGPNREQDIEAFHKEFVKAIEEGAGKDTVKIIGQAKGEKAGYIDLIAWDLMPIMEIASDFLAKDNKVRAGFHVFRRQGDVMGLCRGEIAENKPKAGNPNASQ